jgi:hypothetical protein
MRMSWSRSSAFRMATESGGESTLGSGGPQAATQAAERSRIRRDLIESISFGASLCLEQPKCNRALMPGKRFGLAAVGMAGTEAE